MESKHALCTLQILAQVTKVKESNWQKAKYLHENSGTINIFQFIYMNIELAKPV